MKYQVYLAAAAAAFGAADAQCNANNCARAVTGTRLGPQTQASRRADCSSFQRTTITRFETTTFVTVTSSATFDVTRTFAPSTVTVTTTVPPIIIDPSFSIGLPEPPVVTSFSGPDRRDLEGRQLVSSAIFPPVPFYASACSGASAYRSACSCWGITASFVTNSFPGTTTITITSLDIDTISVIGTGVTTTTVRITSTPTSFVLPSSTSTDDDVSETVEPTSSETEGPSSTDAEPSVTSTDEPSSTETDEPSATSSDEPSATETDEPSATATDEPSATETDEPSATETDEPSATETDGPSATETDEPVPSTTDVFPTSVLPDPTTFATSLLPATSDEPTPTSSDVEPSSTAGPDICTTFGSRFPYTPSTLLTFCSCSYSNPTCAEGTSQNQRTLPLILTIEICANSCDLFANCVAFSYNAVTLECRLLDADGFGTTTGSSDWVLVDRTSGSCSRDTCEPGTASPSPSATPSTLP
ncbi:S-antigen protein [Colletotrichum siamense]|uniref:S-antigen protein n=1 Tax=Colletotrichum siamense TaxID=690259 RepID=UPI001872CDDF|nr:S-antigen protein [Colletotrichum siamense]KAF5506438.1 S-antigen protein [Colletotrichum siamense]